MLKTSHTSTDKTSHGQSMTKSYYIKTDELRYAKIDIANHESPKLRLQFPIDPNNHHPATPFVSLSKVALQGCWEWVVPGTSTSAWGLVAEPCARWATTYCTTVWAANWMPRCLSHTMFYSCTDLYSCMMVLVCSVHTSEPYQEPNAFSETSCRHEMKFSRLLCMCSMIKAAETSQPQN